MQNFKIIKKIFDQIKISDSYFSDIYLIGAQHILPTTYKMINALMQKGLKKENISLIGKYYSTDLGTYNKFLASHVDICSSSLRWDPSEAFDVTYMRHIQIFLESRLERIIQSGAQKLIVLDDGGYLLNIIKKYKNKFKEVIGIEQTSSGYHKLQKEGLELPIINVARSYAKLKYESPIIASVIIDRLKERLGLRSHFTYKNFLIIGYGNIGQAIFNNLKNTYSLDVYDSRFSKYKNLKTCLQKADIIIGCSGETSVSSSLYPFIKPNALLISASSSDREFDAVYYRNQNWPFLIEYNGFPINFSGTAEQVDPPIFEFTRALLVAGILQAVNVENKQDRFYDIDFEIQQLIITEFKKLYLEEFLPLREYIYNS